AIIEGSQNNRPAQAARLRSLNALLPNLSARLDGALEQINLRAAGFNPSIPGIHIPTIIGPFGVADARAYLSQQIFNWSDIKNWKSALESEKASQYTYKRDRDLVALTTGNAYVLLISDSATTDPIVARVQAPQNRSLQAHL